MAADKIFMVYDPRESAVEPFLESTFKDIDCIRKQIPRADYHICRKKSGKPPTIDIALERKTLGDLADSFSDGRDANLEKMLALRKETGCLLAYMIEGPAFPAMTRKFHRKPYSCLWGFMMKLMLRHGILIIQTENQAHTAQRLFELACSLRDEKKCPVFKYPVEVDDDPETDQDGMRTGVQAG